MNLTHEYIKKQGNTGYLHKLKQYVPDAVALLYSQEGVVPELYHTTMSEAKKMLHHWEITGELEIYEFDPASLDSKKKIERPDIVSVLDLKETYRRMDYPQQDGEQPW